MTATVPTVAARPFRLNEQWRDAFNARDLPLLLSMYEPDAVLTLEPGGAPIRGQAAIGQALTGFLGLGGTLSFEPRYWLEQGDIALCSIAFVLAGAHDPTGAPMELRGVTAEVLRRQDDGSWKYVVDHPFAG